MNGTNVLLPDIEQDGSLNSTERSVSNFETHFIETVLNDLDGGSLRWSGGEGDDDVEAVFVSVGSFRPFDLLSSMMCWERIRLPLIVSTETALFF